MKSYDITVWGATSFVGQLITKYLYDTYGLDGEIRWCIAGRSKEKLQQLQEAVGDTQRAIPMLIGDAADANFLNRLAVDTSVVLSTVGPYLKYGEPLISACAEQGTDYCDLTGEVPFVREMIDKYQKRATETGARIINCAGFDSIPSDIGVYALNQKSLEKYGAPIVEAEMHVRKMKGGFSGGTLATAIEMTDYYREKKENKAIHDSYYALCPENKRQTFFQPKEKSVYYDHERKVWVNDFFMGTINKRIVHATNALLGYPYGKGFKYKEKSEFKSMNQVYMTEWMSLLFVAALSCSWTRYLLVKFVLPKPGEGPTQAQQENGFYVMDFYGKTAAGEMTHTTLTGDKDPGYGSTAKIISEVAYLIAKELPKEQVTGGFWTPAAALKDRLLERLTNHAGLTFELQENDAVLQPAVS